MIKKNILAQSDKIDWQEIIEIVEEELKLYKQQGFTPTLRTVFYRLVAKGILPNTKYHYSHLSDRTAEARMTGRLPINCFSDETRHTIKDFNSEYKTIDEVISDCLEELKELPEIYPELIPRWYKQPEYIELWNEKEAMAGIFQSILEDRDIEIVSNKGFSSLTFLWRNMRRLDRWSEIGAALEAKKTGKAIAETKNIHILYFGDFDPSGEEMDKDLRKRINRLRENRHICTSLYEIDFKRIAVTKEQIKEYDLPIDVDAKTQEKLDKDTRTNGFIERHGESYAVELDALPALVPDEFRELVLGSVDQYFKEGIYEKNLDEYHKKYPEDNAKKLLKLKLKEFLKELD